MFSFFLFFFIKRFFFFLIHPFFQKNWASRIGGKKITWALKRKIYPALKLSHFMAVKKLYIYHNSLEIHYYNNLLAYFTERNFDGNLFSRFYVPVDFADFYFGDFEISIFFFDISFSRT